MTRPRVHLYTVCWDEADMLGFFFRHYDPWVDRYVVYDDGSTDGSLDILRAHPKVELRRFERVEAESFVLSHKAMQDQAWQESRDVDWICITAIDEHLHAAGRPMDTVLDTARDSGVTLLPALGFDMNHPVMPDDHGLLVERVTRGRPRSAFNKLSLFRPAFVRETGFGPGRHAAEPVGDLVLPPRDTVMLWHYKHLGFERNAAREAAQAQRLGAVDIANDYGQHYRWSRERLRGFWDQMERDSTDLAAPGFDPGQAAIRPLWWEQRPDIRRQEPRPAPPAEPKSDPTVSVLVKSFDHAAYVGRTIESVLEQSFQDFEIVVTDDGSTDGTRAVIGRYADPRIRLEAFPENRGISAAMNATIARARGRYLAILNSDDWALPGRLAAQVDLLDARPDVSLVFGMPRPVDERGAPIAAYNDFTEPLRLPDFTPDSWLRRFFHHGNCLCAPTAMIRADAYRAAGPYDPRLTNLQDLDMWIRMAMAGHAIHVLPEELTAFRIRDAAANMSAPRPDTMLRSAFELNRVLRRFAHLDPERFETLFGPECPETRGLPVPLRVADLALRNPGPVYQNLAVDLLHEHASSPADHARLRDLAGQVDAFGLAGIAERDRRITELWVMVHARNEAITEAAGRHAADIAGRDAALAGRDAALAEQREALSARDQRLAEQAAAIEVGRRALAGAEAEIARIDAIRLASEAEVANRGAMLALAVASRERMRKSLSWRSTAPLRWIGRRIDAISGARTKAPRS
ncbi:glycosyltransferase [Methylobacterium sp. A54F]